IDTATSRCSTLFLTIPKAKCEVRRVEKFKEETSSGAYYQPGALDGSRPGMFFANLRDMNEVPKWSMPTLAYHEGVPGHHWQLSTAEELKGLPQFRKVLPFTAYRKNWEKNLINGSFMMPRSKTARCPSRFSKNK